jgi:zinc protease
VAGALAIMADVVLNPTLKQDELDLLKSQTLDELKFNLKQPSFIANYVASKYAFGEHPAGGTPESIASITNAHVSNFHSEYYVPSTSVIIFAGDISLDQAVKLVTAAFGKWGALPPGATSSYVGDTPKRFKPSEKREASNRILVIDLPNSGQASVTYALPLSDIGRKDKRFYDAAVLNSVLGGGYSSRLNYEIRIKRGLSYGAGSNFAWRGATSNFATRVQTKNVSTAEVAQLTMGEIKRLTDDSVANDELVPRKSTLTGGFGRNLETTNGLAAAVGELYSFGISPNELNSYVSNVNNVTDAQIRDFASKNLLGGDLIIVGDYSVFKDDLAKRFPGMTIDVIKADDLDLSKPNLRK